MSKVRTDPNLQSPNLSAAASSIVDPWHVGRRASNDPGEANGLFSSARRRTPTSGDASRAIRARPLGPSRPDDEQCPGAPTPPTSARWGRCSPTDHSQSRVGCRNSRTGGETRDHSGWPIVDWVIEVEVVVVHPVHGIPHVVDARERVAALHVVGMLEESVGRMIGAERCAQCGNPDARRLALGVNERKNFVRHIGVVLRLHPAPVEGVRSLVLERIAVHAVYAEDSDAPLLQVGAEGANHALAFHLPFVAAALREGEDGPAVVAINCDAHVAIETVRVPTLMVTMHAVRGYPLRGKFQIPSTKFQSAGRRS